MNAEAIAHSWRLKILETTHLTEAIALGRKSIIVNAEAIALGRKSIIVKKNAK